MSETHTCPSCMTQAQKQAYDTLLDVCEVINDWFGEKWVSEALVGEPEWYPRFFAAIGNAYRANEEAAYQDRVEKARTTRAEIVSLFGEEL